MKRFHSNIRNIGATKLDYEVDLISGYGELSHPTIAFCDEPLTIFSEQWDTKHGWRGWIEEELTSKEYFKRKLKGK